MLRFDLLRDPRILFITPDGPLEGADFEQLAKEIDPLIAANGKLLGVMIRVKSFPGWDSFGAEYRISSSSPIIIDRSNV